MQTQSKTFNFSTPISKTINDNDEDKTDEKLNNILNEFIEK